MEAALIWTGKKPIGQYDVIVNFGSTPAETQNSFIDDLRYDSTLDFLDGADQIGFSVAQDPHARGSNPIGEAEYSFDDAFWLSDAAPSAGEVEYGQPNVDLRAIVRYPAIAEGTNTPVYEGQHPVFIIEHGNSVHCNDDPRPNNSYSNCKNRVLNHHGYNELLNILASHGVISISIDAYDLIGDRNVPVMIEELADLILKHLEFWSHLNDAAIFSEYSDPFAGRFNDHVDLSKISVSGHSRGGEAAVAAYVRNLEGPTNKYFSIKSVSSIAPTVVSRSRSGNEPRYALLNDEPYLLILPAADCDVPLTLSGLDVYDLTGGSANTTTKTGIYVYGANHSFFNTVWADRRDDCESDIYPARVPAAEQQRIGEAYIAAFVRSNLLDEEEYEDLLRNNTSFPSVAGYKIYTFRHEKHHLALDAGTASGITTSDVTAESIGRTLPSVHKTPLIKLKWDITIPIHADKSYSYTFPDSIDATKYEVLSFRTAWTNNSFNANYDQELLISLTGGGEESVIYTSRFNPIPPPYEIPSPDKFPVMTTVRIPLHSFILNNQRVKLDDITQVKFSFYNPALVDTNLPGIHFINPRQGEIYIDDIEFSR